MSCCGLSRKTKHPNNLSEWIPLSLSSSPSLKFFPHRPPASIPSLTVAKFSICSLNYCPWSHKDGNQPVISGVWFRPNPYCPFVFHPQMVAWLLQGTLPLGGFTAILRCEATFSTWWVFFFLSPAIIHKCIRGSFFSSPFSQKLITVSTSNGLSRTNM